MYGLRTGGGGPGSAEEIGDASSLLPWSSGDREAVTPTHILRRKPVEAYLKWRGRFRHLSEPNRQDEAIRHIQERVEAYWQGVKKMGAAS